MKNIITQCLFMSKNHLTLFVILWFSLFPIDATANEVVFIDGIRYLLYSDNKTAITCSEYDGNDPRAPQNNNYSGAVVIPSFVTYNNETYTVIGIGGCSFSFSKVTSVDIPETVKTIGNWAFWNCQELISINIPNSVTQIEQYAFRSTGLTTVTLPENLTEISSGLFSGCRNLISIAIPNGVTAIKDYAFDSCSSLMSISLPNSLINIGDFAFWKCSSLPNINIPDKVESIGKEAFYECVSAESIVIPDATKKITDSAFQECKNVKTINIGKGIKLILNWAFANIDKLTEMKVYAEVVPEIKADAFDGTDIDKATLFVKDELVNSYKNAPVWKNFGNIIGITGTTGIDKILIDNPSAEIYYIDGRRLDQPKRGLNIVRTDKGVKKVIVRK